MGLYNIVFSDLRWSSGVMDIHAWFWVVGFPVLGFVVVVGYMLGAGGGFCGFTALGWFGGFFRVVVAVFLSVLRWAGRLRINCWSSDFMWVSCLILVCVGLV